MLFFSERWHGSFYLWTVPQIKLCWRIFKWFYLLHKHILWVNNFELMIYRQFFKCRWHIGAYKQKEKVTDLCCCCCLVRNLTQRVLRNLYTGNIFFYCQWMAKILEENKNCYAINIPWAGEKTFKYKQSSDWFRRNGNKRFKYSNRPFGILSNAPVSFWIFGKRCGHTGLYLSAIRIPFHGDGARVGPNLKINKCKCVKLSLIFSFSLSLYSCIEIFLSTIKSKWKFNFVRSALSMCGLQQHQLKIWIKNSMLLRHNFEITVKLCHIHASWNMNIHVYTRHCCLTYCSDKLSGQKKLPKHLSIASFVFSRLWLWLWLWS